MSLQVWLPLNGNLENQGLADVTVTNNGATVDNNGKIGKCYSFDGTNDYITLICQDFPTIFCGLFSITFWVCSNDDGTRSIYFGNYGISGGGNWFNLEKNTANEIRFWWNDGNPDKRFNTSKIIQSDGWTHFALTKNGGVVKTYLNGELIETYTNENLSTDVPSTATTFRIGGDYRTSGDLMFNGKMNDFRLYDHALSAKEVKELSKGLVLHYKLSGVGGENLSDFSSIKSNWTMDGLTGSDYTDPDYGNVIKLDSSSTYKRMYHYCNWTADTTYAVSFLAKSSVDGVSCDMSRSIANFSQTFTLSTSWKRYEGVINSTVTATNGTLSFRIHDANATVFITQIKLELGNKATVWIPYSSNSAYTFLDYNDTIEYDHSGYGNDGVKTNITTDVDTPRYSTSYFFDGDTSVITVPYDATAWQTNFTLNLWFKKHELGSKNYETLFGGPSGFEMDTRANNATTLSLYMASTRGGNVYSPFNFDKWYMVTLVNDGTNELYYINGELVKTIEKKAMPTGNYFLGAWQTATKQNFKGWMSDFRIYATPLSEKDIKELYTVGTAFDKQGRVMTYEVVEV